MRTFKESPAFTLSYDLLRWLLPVTHAFPRAQRFVLAQTLNETAFAVHKHLLAAVHTADVRGSLALADLALAQLRTYLRLSYDLQLLGEGSYAHGSRLINDLGRVVGTWRRTLAKSTSEPLE
ncbi:MAG: four helix bundle protein [Herpetosiphonaceae bacterium]|nr:four helix bundle protein [Herpetosiphonaceae bacterium]